MKIKIDLSTLVEVKQDQVHLYYKMWGCTQLNNGHLTLSTEKLFLQCENRYRKNLGNKLQIMAFFFFLLFKISCLTTAQSQGSLHFYARIIIQTSLIGLVFLGLIISGNT